MENTTAGAAIDVLNGESDLRRLDPSGGEHGVFAKLQRSLIRGAGQDTIRIRLAGGVTVLGTPSRSATATPIGAQLWFIMAPQRHGDRSCDRRRAWHRLHKRDAARLGPETRQGHCHTRGVPPGR